MGYDLRNKRGDYFSANISGWDHLREAALAFGWKGRIDVSINQSARPNVMFQAFDELSDDAP